jgi:hypothetical protein
MDFSQTKLTKSEWLSIEIPVSIGEKKILSLIEDGYKNLDIRINDESSMMSLMKIEYTPEIEKFLYTKYFENDVKSMMMLKPKMVLQVAAKSIKQPKKADLLRLNHMDQNVEKIKDRIFEYKQLEFCKELISKKNVPFHLYTLIQMNKSTIINSNQFVRKFVHTVISYVEKEKPKIIEEIFYNMHFIMEKNPNILKYEDSSLYDHQKRLFQLFKSSKESALVLYTSATGSGKTVSPIGLSIGNKIIFICAARHIGLQLAKSAISMGKCVAFAFGCESATDIRLHYYSAMEYTKNKKSGSIAKVDNSDGTKVEIMICDIGSYLTAMYYMLAFNKESDIILYWDEPTITLDHETHPLHETIKTNWKNNKISKVILSCATLPKEIEISETLDDFRVKFDGAQIHSISSFDCKKTISILDSKGMCILPHLLFSKYEDIKSCFEHCQKNKSLLRYFDLRELIRFVKHVQLIVDELYRINNYFTDISEITMNNVKLYYLELLKRIPHDKWIDVYEYMKSTLEFQYSKDNKNPSTGILLTTEDAHTLTDGPTIFIAEDVAKIGKFYIQQSKIPSRNFENIMDKIGVNNRIQKKMDILMKALDDNLGKESEKEKKMEKESFNPDVKKLINSIEILRAEIQMITMEPVYIPNTKQHQQLWRPKGEIVTNAFIPTIEENTIREIMELNLDNQMKLLLLLGIGVFDITNSNITYMEIMKRLVTDQKLFLIIASSDYIYGTNYQMCHGFLGKDLVNMTQQKIIQAMGRVGRGNIQQEYTVRFRDDNLLTKLFLPTLQNREADNICKLLRN